MQDVIEKYRRVLPVYERYSERLQMLLADILSAESIKVHFIESRAKTPESLREKVSRPGKRYEDPISEVADLVGARVVLYYQDDVEKVGKLIASEFLVLEEEKTHHVEKYSPDQFGYLSVHYVVKLGNSRSTLAEWAGFSAICAEIQVRTVLQHSWAAVSHALQYKREGDVPIALRRRLFRLAGLFELADEQFVDIRDERRRLLASSKEVDKVGENVQIDSLVIRSILASSPDFKRIVQSMRGMGYRFEGDVEEEDIDYLDYYEEDESPDYIGIVVEEMERLGVAELRYLRTLLTGSYEEFFERIFVEKWHVTEGFTLYLILIACNTEKFSVDYLVNNSGWHRAIAERVLNGAKEFSGSK